MNGRSWKDTPGGQFADPLESNIPEYSVEEISIAIRRTVEERFDRIRVRGEVSSLSRPRSGHIYLNFKKDRHQLDAVIWRSTALRLKKLPEEGMEYVATGNLTTYSGNSRYQLIIDKIEPAGKGALLAMIEERRARLQAEGLFDSDRKQPLPFIPNLIGVVTSPSGAVIRDILHRLRDRFPRTVLVWPVAVQGPSCADEVASAIRGFNALSAGGPIPRPDLLIVARGGGSFEDLLGFNEESVVRAAAESKIPLISAVGHESDTTLIDYAADLRAPTPTAAAERAVPVRVELSERLRLLDARHVVAMRRSVESNRQRLQDIGRSLPQPEALFAIPRQRFDHSAERLPLAFNSMIQKHELALAGVAMRLARPAAIELAQRRYDRLAADLGRQAEARILAVRGSLTAVMARFGQRLLRGRLAAEEPHLEYLSERMSAAIAARRDSRRVSLDATSRLLWSLGYRQTLARGYTVVRADGKVAASRLAASSAEQLDIEFRDGHIVVSASGGKELAEK